ncbi:MAG TPA: hypothetical protein VD997_17000 [Phycisphaerales bacterium]|nr:hypothetical protein [Phycisphaerales bacterium]
MLRNAESGPLKAVKNGLGDGLPSQYGLCGGMSLASADFYLSKRAMPEHTKAPEQGTDLYEYLYQRQTDSMGSLGVMAVKFWRWMNLPDRSPAGESTSRLSAQELPVLVKRLKARQLVPVGLVYTSTDLGGKLWENHQVLAYDLAEKAGGVVELKIYDPNFPSDDNCILRVTPIGKDTASPREVKAERITGKGSSKKVRGFFAMPYEPRVPEKKLSPEKPKPKKPAAKKSDEPAKKPEAKPLAKPVAKPASETR